MDNLLKLRTKKKMSQVSLAVKLGIAQETVSAYEKGKAYPSVETLIKLCDIFNVSADFILDRTDIDIPINDIMKEFSNDEKELINIFRKLPQNKKERVLGFVMGIIENS